MLHCVVCPDSVHGTVANCRILSTVQAEVILLTVNVLGDLPLVLHPLAVLTLRPGRGRGLPKVGVIIIAIIITISIIIKRNEKQIEKNVLVQCACTVSALICVPKLVCAPKLVGALVCF